MFGLTKRKCHIPYTLTFPDMKISKCLELFFINIWNSMKTFLGQLQSFFNFTLITQIETSWVRCDGIGNFVPKSGFVKIHKWNYCMGWLFSVPFAKVWPGSKAIWALFLITSLLEIILGYMTDNLWSKSKIMVYIRSEDSSRRSDYAQRSEQDRHPGCQGAGITGTSQFFHIDFWNISICKYVALKLRFYIFLSNSFYSIQKLPNNGLNESVAEFSSTKFSRVHFSQLLFQQTFANSHSDSETQHQKQKSSNMYFLEILY